jgi:hypothetical protein
MVRLGGAHIPIRQANSRFRIRIACLTHHTRWVPTILRSGSYRFSFYAADGHEPPHVHPARESFRSQPSTLNHRPFD